MKFGLWDHVDQSDKDLATQYDERLDFVAAADKANFYCYHVAEHHATPLNLVPVPGIYLGAVARMTENIRLGPLVYLLPLYSPLRLIEEISILDHLSHGRLDVGVGRGVSPFELNFHNVDPETSREVFIEAIEAVTEGLTHDRLTHSGKHFSYTDVPMELRPHQQPHPPLWYASTSETGAKWAGEMGFNFSTLGAMEKAAQTISIYKEALAARGKPLLENPDFEEGTAIGVVRHVVIADTMDEAVAASAPAYNHWYASLTKLERDNVAGPRIATSMFEDVNEAIDKGLVIVGPPDTVRDALKDQFGRLDANYYILGFFFGTLPVENALRSLDLFATEIMPELSAL